MKNKNEVQERLNVLYKEHVQSEKKYDKGKIRKAIEELEWVLN